MEKTYFKQKLLVKKKGGQQSDIQPAAGSWRGTNSSWTEVCSLKLIKTAIEMNSVIFPTFRE